MISQSDFATLCTAGGMPQAAARYASFARYCALLQEWNEKMNLTAITDDAGVAEKHFLDSVLPLRFFDLPQGARLIDVGAGAGFPGVPLVLLRPDLSLTLLDPTEKRLTFLQTVCAELEIFANTVHLRAEQAGREPAHREQYDIATSRAVAQLGLLAEYCLPLLAAGGTMLALKGQLSEAELSAAAPAIRLCGGELSAVERYALPSGDARTLVVVKKISQTPTKYPRPTAKIGKTPLK